MQLDKFYILQIMIDENIRSQQGNLPDETLEHTLPVNGSIHMPVNMATLIIAAFFMFRGIHMRRGSCIFFRHNYIKS